MFVGKGLKPSPTKGDVMSTANFLKTLRIFCITQFILVFLWALSGGLLKSEMLYILTSAVFGLLLDGFAYTVVKGNEAQQKKKILDSEFNQILQDLDKRKNTDA
jgi:hypothetical protein